ncbi:hypothetical protein ASPSYDRAFT_83499 [Aspergillus sydowii CBS 593.65]|uniref:Uncharacterized protein n=1 Tax=Aspergillus sydowii CBS 593.65 TaxID=1036612 RepID=A0A1L9TVW6_9EURO|nr:uncharacterized protein ASPSYDRAFT_83499 [Aspergillus sydowii CBS 593.65]OJJ63433.1 hypothetical protein ASPSYDRAFT_83499 [Aspergillus sydowii CBS 593.65]
MGFWKGWALWQKLSIFLVLVYSFIVLTHNRRKIRRQAAKEANERAEQKAEMGEAGSESNEIPFGATALEKGIEVEGIWTMKRQSTAKPPTAMEKRRSSILGSLLRHKSAASSFQEPHKPDITSTTGDDSHRSSGTADSHAESVLESIHIDTFRSSRPPKLDIGGMGAGDREGPRLPENERPLSRLWFVSRSSWMKPIVGYKRMSVRDTRRRGSSEDFRRRFSKLFDETLPPGPPRPAERFQLTPIYQESNESSGRPSLESIIEQPVIAGSKMEVQEQQG